MTARGYSSPVSFKQALEQRLRSSTSGGTAFARRRQLLVFDRFLARIAAELGDAATLKGGLVLELRLERARTTKDVDLRLTGSADSANLKASWLQTYCPLPASRHQHYGSTRWRHTSQRSCTLTRCRAAVRTPA